MSTSRILRWSRSRHLRIAGLAFLLVLFHPGTASALVTENYLRGQVTASGPLAGIYDYSQASVASWSASAAFNAGTHNGTTVQGATDVLTLDRIGPTGVVAPDLSTPWFDPDWNTRECHAVDHTAGSTSVTEYAVELAFASSALVAAGLLQADLGDLRAVASDGATVLPVWVEDVSTAWVQIDAIPAGGSTEFCLYYGYEPGGAVAPVTNTRSAVFTYSTPKPVYYAVSARYTGAQTVNVASYVDGNTIERVNGAGTVSVTLDDGDLGSLGGITAGTEFRVMGPIAGRGVGDGLDTLVPVAWAGTRFVVPSNRRPAPAPQQRLSFYAPFAGATIDIYAGGDPAPLATVSVGAGSAGSWLETPADAIGPGESVIIESTVPILAHHATDGGEDAMPLHPVTSQDWFGVSSVGHLGFDGDAPGGTATSARVFRSNTGGSVALNQFRGDEIPISGTIGGGGADDGIMVRLDGGPAGAAATAISQGDGTGADSVTFLPRDELGDRYLLVTGSTYIATSCPGAAAITVTTGGGATSNFSCTGTATVGHGVETAAHATGGGRAIEVASGGDPFYVVYNDAGSGDETNVLGIAQGRQYVWPAPAVSAQTPEGRTVASGTWESATFDTGSGSEVFGAIRTQGAMDPATSIEIRVATSDGDPPTAFVGPDGTPATFWTPGNAASVLDYGHDGDRYLRVRVDMATTDRFAASPEVSAIEIDHQLLLVDRAAGGRGSGTVAGSTTATTTYVFRIRTDATTLGGSAAAFQDLSVTNGANLDNGALRVENLGIGLDVTQWSTGGAAGSPVAFDDGQPHSVVLDHTSLGPGTTAIDFIWNLNVGGGSSIFVQSDLTVEIVTT
jgi:hypothetical protein